MSITFVRTKRKHKLTNIVTLHDDDHSLFLQEDLKPQVIRSFTVFCTVLNITSPNSQIMFTTNTTVYLLPCANTIIVLKRRTYNTT